MADNSYAQLIDDFDAGIQVLKGETLTEYIKRMGGVDYNAHGGSVGIEVLFNKRKDFASGGWHPGVGRDTRGYQTTSLPHSGGGGGPPSILNPPSPIIPKTLNDPSPPKDVWNVGTPSQPYNPALSEFRNYMYGVNRRKQKNFLENEEERKIKENVDDWFETPAKSTDLLNLAEVKEDVTLPGNNLLAEVTKQDLARYTPKYQKDLIDKQDYNSAIDSGTINPNMSEFEFNKMKEGKITEPGTYTEETQFSKDGGRVGFSNGGSGNWWDNLEGEALSIYNSMSAYDASDADIQAKLQEQNLWSPDGSGGGGGGTGQVTGIINQNIGGGGGGGIGGLDLTFTEGAKAKAPATFQGDYDIEGNKINELGRTGILGAWDKTKDFFSGLGTPRVKGTLGTRLSNQPRLPLPAAMASWSLSPFNTESRNYNENFIDQLNFLEMGAGNPDSNMIGRDSKSGLLRYGPDSVLSGKNVISLAGTNNYVEALQNYLTKMRSYKNLTEGQQNKIKKGEQELKRALNQTYTGPTDVSSFDETIKVTGPTYGPHTPQGNQGGYSHPGSAKSREMSDPFNEGGLATMFTRRR